MEEVKSRPAAGLTHLNFALGQPSEEEICKTSAPKVFELLPKAIGSLAVAGSDVKAITAACAVIERCVKLVNDPSVGACPPTIAAGHVQQCTENLIRLAKKALDKGRKTHNEHFMEDEECSKFVTVIAAGLQSLLNLEDHAASCRNVFKLGGMKVAIDCVAQNSGLTLDAQRALVRLFAALLEAPGDAQRALVSDFSSKGGTYALVPYCADPRSYGVGREFQQECVEVLEICIKSGSEVKNKADVEGALLKASDGSGWGWAKSSPWVPMGK